MITGLLQLWRIKFPIDLPEAIIQGICKGWDERERPVYQGPGDEQGDLPGLARGGRGKSLDIYR